MSMRVVFFFLFILNNSVLIFLLFLVFRLLVGLLVKSILGEVINVCVMVMCCCLFFDNWLGKWCVWCFKLICFRIFKVSVFGLLSFVIFVGSIIFFKVVKFWINIKFWKMKFILFFFKIVCFFLFILWSVLLFKKIFFFVIWLSLVNKFKRVDLFEFDVLIMVMDLLDLILKEIGWRICSEFLFVFIILVIVLVFIIRGY